MTRSTGVLGAVTTGNPINVNNLYIDQDNSDIASINSQEMSELTDPIAEEILTRDRELDNRVYWITKFGTIHNIPVDKRTDEEISLLIRCIIIDDEAPTHTVTSPELGRRQAQKQVSFREPIEIINNSRRSLEEEDDPAIPHLCYASDDSDDEDDSLTSTTISMQIQQPQEEYYQEKLHWDSPSSVKSLRQQINDTYRAAEEYSDHSSYYSEDSSTKSTSDSGSVLQSSPIYIYSMRTIDIAREELNALPPPQPPPKTKAPKPYHKNLTALEPPPGATEFIIREGEIYDLRGATLNELVEAIMGCRDNDGKDPIQIQIDTDQQEELQDYICAPDRLKELQAEEQLAMDKVDAELDIPCLELLRTICTNTMQETRPQLFPEELWEYVNDEQKPLIADRMALFDQELLETDIFNFRQKLRINSARPHCAKYYEAQALANLDRYLLVDENNPPMVSDEFIFPIDLIEGAVVEKCKPQTFNEVQKKFLTAKTHRAPQHKAKPGGLEQQTYVSGVQGESSSIQGEVDESRPRLYE